MGAIARLIGNDSAVRYAEIHEAAAVTTANRRICAVCDRAFARVRPPGEEKTERDWLCPTCLALQAPPDEPQ